MGSRVEQLYVLQKAVEAAQNSLSAAQAQANGDCNPKNAAFVCDQSRAKVNAAITSLNQAKLQYELQTAPPTATDLAQAQDAVIQAQASLDKLINSYTDTDLIQAQASVNAQDAIYRSALAAL